MYRLKFEIFIAKEPRDKFEALREIKEAMNKFACPEEFVVWKEEREEK